ncbi:DUF2058 domain-containing protein [Dyella sp. A6]|uniref:DUF2058 domain-containing protein n=1 Tax=Dyella aluminiiresistens TaxID=3069105 RepID=UPI002E77E925|nr:DUF2058 family protein [Dyella sp. A6]
MADSLRDQLLKSGIVKQVRDEKRPKGPQGRRPGTHKGASQSKAAGRDGGEIDLAKAYAMRARSDADERRKAEREAAEQARLKRERKQKVQSALQGKALNKAEADQARHFEYAGKIRRVYVDAPQLAALNAGDLGIVQQGGRYLLVGRAVAEQVRAIDPGLVALLVEQGTGGIGEDGVPDDLMW